MTKAGARLFLHAGFATAALLLFAAASSRAETLDQLYEKAKFEKTLVFYSGGSGCTAREPGQGVHAEIPRHRSVGDRRLQQRAE
jgi:UDP-N-acetyl-D-mannosaminuronic acid transferase (WecB/TagA/CpsF family)